MLQCRCEILLFSNYFLSLYSLLLSYTHPIFSEFSQSLHFLFITVHAHFKMADWKVFAGIGIGVGAAAACLYIGYNRGKYAIVRPVGKTYNSDNPLSNYLLEHNVEDPALAELRKASISHSKGRMTSSGEVGRLLTVLCTTLGANKAIDIGLFTGCSSFSMAKGLKAGGRVIACDITSEYAEFGRPFWNQGGVAEMIDVRIKPALDTLQELIDAGESETFDIIFIDAYKRDYPDYYTKGITLLRSGGMFVVDNALWNGKVADPSLTDEGTVAIRRINELMSNDKRVEFVLMNVSDGVGVAVKK